jgi:sigma-B regulation protein RsbU (phosphoserine phosphatase)
MTNKNAILISDPKADPRFAEQKSIIMSELKSAVAVPLFDEGEVLGILYADTTSPLQSYTDEHLRVLATFGNIIASRLVNYELVDERQAKQVMEKELRRASSIQKELLVKVLPQVDGYTVHAFQEQSRSVGGDLYDVCRLPDGQLLFLVADVSGKGLGAALLMSNILASFRILYESPRFDLATAVKRVSLQLFRNTDAEDFATLIIGQVDPASGDVRYINAGHNPPLLVRSDGSHEYLEPCGVMIGAFDFPGWEEKSVNLSEGELIFIFSDGVTEADAGHGQYGDKRTEELVLKERQNSPAEITSSLMNDINNFMGDAPRSDDITTLILKRGSN